MIQKFRAWDKENNEMLFPDDTDKLFFEITVDGIVTYDMRHITDYEGEPPRLSTAIMQFTGLKDKQSVEIFEGDIVDGTYPKGEHFRGVVQYDDESAAFVCKTTNSWMPSAMINCRNCEVIGNIWEHPELLEVK